MKALLDDQDFGESSIFSNNAASVRRIAGGDVAAELYFMEAAGHGFFERFEAIAGARGESKDSESSDEEDGREETAKNGKKEKKDYR